MCIAAMRSMTHAIKAKKAIDALMIDSKIIKLDPNLTKKGCAYGVEFPCESTEQVISALIRERVKYTEIVRNRGSYDIS